MIPDSDLIAAGYKPFPPNRKLGTQQYADRAFQKRLRNNDGQTTYFINVYQYDAHHDHPGTESSEAEVVMYPKWSEESWVTIELHKAKTLAGLEWFFADAYKQLSMVPDRYNQE